MIPRSGGTDEKFFEQLKADFPEFKFLRGVRFKFRPPRTIIVEEFGENWRLLALHEVGHAVSGHRNFAVDVARVKMEMEAWERARELADRYNVPWDEEFVQGELDSYREWLHQKSRCPKCGLTRFETPGKGYTCPRCDIQTFFDCLP